MQVPIANSKLDISFANSLARLKTDVIIQIVLHAVQFITMIVMIPIEVYVYKHNNQSVLSFFITATCITFMNMSAKLGHLLCTLGNAAQIMSIATQLNHVVIDQQASQRLGQVQFNGPVVVSQKVYNVQNNTTIQQANQLMKQSLQPALKNMIKTISLSHDPLNRCAINLGSVFSFALFIYGIVILATVPQMEVSQIAVMSTFLVSEFIIQINIYLCLLFIAILPVLCIFICFYACFCKQGSKKAKLPQAIPATTQIIQRSDGQPCSICFQNIMLNQQVIILQCQGHHTFHQNCITTWATVKPTCPNCRFDLSE